MAQPARDRADELYEQYLSLPEHLHGEIVHGTLYVMPRPAPRHANASSVLGAELGSAFQRGRGGPGGWWILFEPEIWLVPKEAVVPDLAGWRVERMPELPETAYFSVVPDWICEVLSPSTERLDRDHKLPLYAEHGVRHVWLVDPIAKRLEVYTLDPAGGAWREVRTHQGDVGVRAPPFEAIELELAALWSPPRAG
jgi:Uma2 family endonuclease